MKSDKKVHLFYLGSANYALLQQLLNKIETRWQIIPVTQNQLDMSAVGDEHPVILIYDSDSDFPDHPPESETQYAILRILHGNEQPPTQYESLRDYLETPLKPWKTMRALHSLAATLEMKRDLRHLEDQLTLQSQELSELTQIGIALSAERDPDALLRLILSKALEITSADAGSLYLVEKNQEIATDESNFWVDKQLRFKLSMNKSLTASYEEFVMPIQKKSMAGYTAVMGRPLNISNAYELPQDSEFQHNRSFDEKMGYHTKSVLCIPMKSHQGEMIGVLQLINRKKDWTSPLIKETFDFDMVIPFDDRCVNLASSLASQAAVSIENMRLYEEIKRLFEGFIVASVHAIEQRDPTTSGHSERVAKLTVGLAQTIDRVDQGIYKNIRFTRDDIQQIKYASLLHDFGKIGVREHVLTKAKKLYPDQLDAIKFRFELIKKATELNYSHEKIKLLLHDDRSRLTRVFQDLDQEFLQKLQEIDHHVEFILQANEPRVLAEGGFDKLVEISQISFQRDDQITPYLTSNEVRMLSIAKGSLSEEERLEIESHVTHTFNFLSRIPWASHLKSVPQIAYAHHEKLDGRGYPRGLTSQEIPLPSKMMAISDIFDALTAADRPYKKAVATERALSILEFEVNGGKIDAELFKVFVESEIFKLVLNPDRAG